MTRPLSQEVRLLEAILFSSPEPVTSEVLHQQVGADVNVLDILQELKAHYAQRGITLVETGGAWSFRTATDLADRMKITRRTRRKLPRAAAEVLAIIAYHQPITRAEIESVRGVETSRGTLDILLELSWVRPGKHLDTPGRPMTWHTTQDFLSHFNLETLKDLPGVDELRAAGLLDARPVLSNLPREQDTSGPMDSDGGENDFASWVEHELDGQAAE